jgi:DNA processing protein
MLLQYFGSAEDIFHASIEALTELKAICRTDSGVRLFSDEDMDGIINNRNRDVVHHRFTKLIEHGIQFITKEDCEYPEKLRHIYTAPYALYVKGRLPDPETKCLAVVGARECSTYGREMAEYLAGAVAKEGIAIISGLARGIDSYAHHGALVAGGKTYGIMGCGIDICYPKENINLYMEMQKEGGIISEYAPGIKPLAGNFPLRNRIISALSDGILVIEAREKSGSLITVDMGLEQGKDIYAVPGRVTDCLSGGCNNLIKMGAKLITSPKDILEEFIPGYMQEAKRTEKEGHIPEGNQKLIYSCLSIEPKHIEEIAILTKLPMDTLMEQLLLLELGGMVKQSTKNYYMRFF